MSRAVTNFGKGVTSSSHSNHWMLMTTTSHWGTFWRNETTGRITLWKRHRPFWSRCKKRYRTLETRFTARKSSSNRQAHIGWTWAHLRYREFRVNIQLLRNMQWISLTTVLSRFKRSTSWMEIQLSQSNHIFHLFNGWSLKTNSVFFSRGEIGERDKNQGVR